MTEAITFAKAHHKELLAIAAALAAIARTLTTSRARRDALDILAAAIEAAQATTAKRLVNIAEGSSSRAVRRAIQTSIARANGFPHGPQNKPTRNHP